MERARTQGPDGSGGRWWRSRSTLAICAVIAAPLAFLVFSGNLLAVPFVYAVLFVEGDAVIYLAIWRSQSVDGRKVTGADGGALIVKHSFLSAGRVETLDSYVKGAEKGSDFSRREIARTLAAILGHSHTLTPSGMNGGSYGVEPSGAFSDVVSPYLDDPVVKARLGGIEAGRLGGRVRGTVAKPRAADRGRYITSLEAVVSELETELDRSGSLATADPPGGRSPPKRGEGRP